MLRSALTSSSSLIFRKSLGDQDYLVLVTIGIIALTLFRHLGGAVCALRKQAQEAAIGLRVLANSLTKLCYPVHIELHQLKTEIFALCCYGLTLPTKKNVLNAI